MKLFLLGKRGSITGWLEDAGAAFVADGHEVRIGIVRDPRLHPRVQAALNETIGRALASRLKRFAPDLVLVIGGFHTPAPILERIAAAAGRAPVVGWIGDAFGEDARELAALYDLAAYTDSGFVARHRELGFPSDAIFAPHAIDPHAPRLEVERIPRMVFVATATPGRQAVVENISSPLTLHGSGWKNVGVHDVGLRRVRPAALPAIYASHLASLNIRNEFNVMTGLNQRSFQPYLQATPVASDDQPDLALCFEPDREVFVWRDTDELNDLYARLLKAPRNARAVGEAGRRRLLAEHTYGHRLATLSRNLS